MSPCPATTVGTDSCPPSAVSAMIGIAGVFGLVAGTWLALSVAWPYTLRALLVLATTALPMIAIEWRWRRLSEAGASLSAQGDFSATGWRGRTRYALRRTLGLAVTLALFIPAYAALEWIGPIGRPLRQVFLMFAIVSLALAVPAYWWQSRGASSDDPCWRIGDALLGAQWPGFDASMREHLRQWTLKSFFIPFLFWAASNNLIALEQAWRQPANSLDWFVVAHQLIYLLDVAIGCIGYFVTVRAFGSHIRSSNPYWLAWLSCLVCYPPFWPVMHDWLLNYDRNGDWFDRVAASGALFYPWAALIIALELVYVWATVVFGIRFSNLTNRGILTNGPYRWVKHPAYLAKNLSWWLWTMPFVPVAGWGDAALCTAQLLLLNFIYFTRAKTEEWHLRDDPAYRVYETWMQDHSLFGLARRGAAGIGAGVGLRSARL